MPLSPHIRDRILRQLDQLGDDRGYQVLDFIEFMQSKYAERQPAGPSIFTRFSEGVEDTMRAGRISTTAIAETMGLLNRAMGVLNGVAAAGKSVASEIVTVASSAVKPPPPATDETRAKEPGADGPAPDTSGT
jgi:hypothetical protein